MPIITGKRTRFYLADGDVLNIWVDKWVDMTANVQPLILKVVLVKYRMEHQQIRLCKRKVF